MSDSDEPNLFDDPDEPEVCPTCRRPYATDRGYHSARNTDPSSSRDAVDNRQVTWDSKRGIALRIHAKNLGGLTHYEVYQIAAQYLGPNALGDCWWKRVGELGTEYDPPLIEPLLDENGNQVQRPGRFGDGVGVYRITPDGVAMARRMTQPG